jgi:hypothetical protein
MNEHLPPGDERPEPPHPAYDDIRSRLGAHAEGHAALDALHAALSRPSPRAADIATRVEQLRGIPVLEAQIANWWDSPRTQNWLKIIADAGL